MPAILPVTLPHDRDIEDSRISISDHLPGGLEKCARVWFAIANKLYKSYFSKLSLAVLIKVDLHLRHTMFLHVQY